MLSLMSVLEVLWLMLPAYGANMIPVVVRKLGLLEMPVDMGLKWEGRRILGDHKTWRGLFFGILVAFLLAVLQRSLYGTSEVIRSISLVDYSQDAMLLFGLLLGFGALLGDMVESYFKRRMSIKPGHPWFPWDMVDWVIGSLALGAFFYFPDLIRLLLILVLFPALHVLTNMVSYSLKVRDTRW